MMNEDIYFRLKATGEAETIAKIKKAERAMKDNVRETRESGEAAKKATEFTGTFANALGDSQFAAFAGTAAQMTERVTHLSAGLKEGGKNAVLFKAGIAGLVGVVAFKLGGAIDNAIFKTDKLKQQMEDANEAAKKFATEGLNLLGQQAKEMDLDVLKRNIDGKREQRDAAIERGDDDARDAAQAMLDVLNKQQVALIAQTGHLADARKAARELAISRRDKAYVEQLKIEVESQGRSARSIELLAAVRKTANGKDLSDAIGLINIKHDFIDAEKAKEEQEKKTHDARLKRIKEQDRAEKKLLADRQKAYDKFQKENQRERKDQITERINKLRENNTGSSGQAESSQGVDNRFGSGKREARDAQRARKDQMTAAIKRNKLLEEIKKLEEKRLEIDREPQVVLAVNGP